MKASHDLKHKTSRFLFNDEKMFEFVFKAYFPRLMAFASKYISNQEEVEDIIQGVFLKVWEKRKEIKEETFHSYIFTLVRNACLNKIKHQQIINSHSSEQENILKAESIYYADFFNDPLHQTIYHEIQDKIEKVVQSLPEQTQKVFRLSRFKGMKNTEIAEMLNISLRTIEKHNSKALQKLKIHLTDHYLYALIVLEIMRDLNN